ncbi:uncharacterized protein LOC105687714 isoform X2 [Athalia rosae]|uniref:uncharacterized protein LOC105687714 isoform X2 n=1 Tax=Athalia rosae TaxID=37344 RepID=UPI002033F4B7|nr:uncharacterized protein LOC105687714 isoform X2 [Athalia rosae]
MGGNIKYQPLFQKPRLSRGLKRFQCGRFKIIVIGVLTISLLVVAVRVISRHIRLTTIRNIQNEFGDMFDVELATASIESSKPHEWKLTDVEESHIFSAYLDTRPEVILDHGHNDAPKEITWAMIRIIAILPSNLTSAPLTCVYKYRNNGDYSEDSFTLRKRGATSVQQAAAVERHGMKYNAFFVLCDLKIDTETTPETFYLKKHIPYEITFTDRNLDDPGQVKSDSFVRILYPENGISRSEVTTDFMAVCVGVSRNNFDRALNLVEYIEFYRMMGVGRFTFYNNSISARANAVLEYYRDRGVVDVMNWDLPPYYVSERTLRVDGMFAALNDCLYRSSFHKKFKYVAIVDVDEFIVPRKHDNFESMMRYLDPVKPDGKKGKQASFVFRNMFFYLMLDDDPVTLAPDVPKLLTHSKTSRWEGISPWSVRSKYVVRGRDAVELGNHQTWQLRNTCSPFSLRYQEYAVDPAIAASQHYRYCETNIETCWQRRTLRDRTAHKFTKLLGDKVAAACREIANDSCSNGD